MFLYFFPGLFYTSSVARLLTEPGLRTSSRPAFCHGCPLDAYLESHDTDSCPLLSQILSISYDSSRFPLWSPLLRPVTDLSPLVTDLALLSRISALLSRISPSCHGFCPRFGLSRFCLHSGHCYGSTTCVCGLWHGFDACFYCYLLYFISMHIRSLFNYRLPHTL